MPLFTVFAVYESDGQRFSDSVDATDSTEAQRRIREAVKVSGENLLIAAVVEGDVNPVESETYGHEPEL